MARRVAHAKITPLSALQEPQHSSGISIENEAGKGVRQEAAVPMPADRSIGKFVCHALEYVIHAARAVDPLIGELFVCPYTLEAICLKRLLGLSASFVWERVPHPWPSGEALPLFGTWGRPLVETSLPAAVHRETGQILSGRILVEALRRACKHSRKCAAVRSLNTADTLDRSGGSERGRGGPLEASMNEAPFCIGSCDPRNFALVERATQHSATELVEQAVQSALVRYFISFLWWRELATSDAVEYCTLETPFHALFKRASRQFYCQAHPAFALLKLLDAQSKELLCTTLTWGNKALVSVLRSCFTCGKTKQHFMGLHNPCIENPLVLLTGVIIAGARGEAFAALPLGRAVHECCRKTLAVYFPTLRAQRAGRKLF